MKERGDLRTEGKRKGVGIKDRKERERWWRSKNGRKEKEGADKRNGMSESV